MSVTIELPANAVTFPARCFLCRGSAEITRKVAAAKGIDVAGYGYSSDVEVNLPLCNGCSRHVRRMRAFWWLAAIVLFVAVMAALGGWGLSHDQTWMVILAAMLFMGLGFFSSMILPQLLDQWQLGVSGITHRQKGAVVRLSFRSEESAREVEVLTRDRLSGVLASAEREFIVEQRRREGEELKKVSPRLIFAIVTAVGLGLYVIEPDDPGLGFLAATTAILCAAAVVDPRLPFAIGKYSKSFSRRYVLLARSILVVGILAGLAVALHRQGLI